MEKASCTFWTPTSEAELREPSLGAEVSRGRGGGEAVWLRVALSHPEL